jgi:hypothetical protein
MTYITYGFGVVLVEVGQVLNKYDLLVKWNTVDDYITNPTWFDGVSMPALFDGDFTHPDYLASPTALLYVRDGGREYQQYLYNLFDTVLKYNIVYLKSELTSAVPTRIASKIIKLFGVIKSGFPVYIYPFIDVFFTDLVLDGSTINNANDSVNLITLDMLLTGDDLVVVKLGNYHNGEYFHDGTINRVYGNQPERCYIVAYNVSEEEVWSEEL